MLEGKRILLLAATTGYQVRVFADAAQRLGLEVVLATDRCHQLDDPWGDEAIAVRFEHPEQSTKVLERVGRARHFDGIVAVGDRPTYLAAVAAERLGIPYSPPAAVAACRDKYLTRQCFQVAGLGLPGFFRVGLEEDPGQAARRAPYPCVLKPLGLSGSRGVIRADNVEGFVGAFERIKALLESREIRRLGEEQNRYLQVESFIEGREFALEGMLTDGRLQVLALFDKPDPLNGPFFEETIYVTPSRESAGLQHRLIQTTRQGIRALGLIRGPVHAELRVNRHGIWILEVAARPIGGLCARALRFDHGMPLEELILRHAVGEDISPSRLTDPSSGVMMIPIPEEGIYEDVEGVERANSVPAIEEVVITAKQGQKLVPLPEGSSYLGFIFARGNQPDEVEAALRRAHRELEFRISKVLPVLTP
jgi:biotin carboxylase